VIRAAGRSGKTKARAGFHVTFFARQSNKLCLRGLTSFSRLQASLKSIFSLDFLKGGNSSSQIGKSSSSGEEDFEFFVEDLGNKNLRRRISGRHGMMRRPLRFIKTKTDTRTF
jgi:hypothetical protein